MPSGIHSGGMDIATVREWIVRAFEATGETQEVVAARAGLRQGHFAKLIDLTTDMTEIRARVLFDVIERGLQTPLSEFFRQLERSDHEKFSSRPAQPAHPQVFDEATTQAETAEETVIRTLSRLLGAVEGRIPTPLDRQAPDPHAAAAEHPPRGQPSRRRPPERQARRRPRRPKR